METPLTEIMSSLLAVLDESETTHYTAEPRYIGPSVIQTGAMQMRHYVRTIAASLGAAAIVAALPLGAASEKIDYDAITNIKEQGLQPQNSKVMEISSWLTDVYGPRL